MGIELVSRDEIESCLEEPTSAIGTAVREEEKIGNDTVYIVMAYHCRGRSSRMDENYQRDDLLLALGVPPIHLQERFFQ